MILVTRNLQQSLIMDLYQIIDAKSRRKEWKEGKLRIRRMKRTTTEGIEKFKLISFLGTILILYGGISNWDQSPAVLS